VVGPTPAQPSVFPAEVQAVQEQTARLHRLAHAWPAPLTSWRLHPGVEALQALRGVPWTVAVTLGADLGDRTRVDPPRARMTCLGLSPSASTRAERRRHGSRTTAGHTQARRARVAGAWASRDPANVRRPRPRRREQHPHVLQDLRGKAQVRLGQRDRRRLSRGTPPHVVTVAMARERVGFLGAMAHQVPGTASVERTHRHGPRTSAGWPRGLGKDAAPVWCHPRRREEAGRGHSSRDRGRHPTEARPGVAHPRLAAGATVGSDGLRRFQGPEDKTSCRRQKVAVHS
jgi:Transposase IS116/IS110/IS902 family